MYREIKQEKEHEEICFTVIISLANNGVLVVEP